MAHTLGSLRVVGPSEEFAVEDGALLGGDCDILDKHGKVIAETYHHVGYDDVRPAYANAVLFAAAPDLLAACEALVLAVGNSWEELDLSHIRQVDEAYGQACAAIANAAAEENER